MHANAADEAGAGVSSRPHLEREQKNTSGGIAARGAQGRSRVHDVETSSR